MIVERRISAVEVLHVWKLAEDHRTPLEFVGEAYRNDGTSFNCYGFKPPSQKAWSIYTIDHGHIKKYGTCKAKNIIWEFDKD